MNSFLPYAKQSITEVDIKEVAEALGSDLITRGHKVDEFEKTLSEFCGAKYAVAFPNATSALMAACHAAEMGPSDRLITTPNTFVATVGAGVLCKSTPVFVDIDLSTGNFLLDQVKWTLEHRSSRGKDVIIPVHFSGISIDMKTLELMVKNPNTVIIEDAAHAIGSKHPDGSMVGSCRYSQMTVFSFHPAKTMTTGEGGMVTTNDLEFSRRLKLYRNNGIERDPAYLAGPEAPWYYEVKEITGNYNFTEFQAALGLSQLKRLPDFVQKRRTLVEAYRNQLATVPNIRLFTDQYDASTAFHLFVVQIDFKSLGISRTDVMMKLMDKGIGTQLHYIPLYRHPVFREKMGDLSEYFPNMETYYAQALSLPLFFDMNVEEVERVVETLKGILHLT